MPVSSSSSPHGPHWLSLPNLLSLARLPLAVLAATCVLQGAFMAAMVVFWVAVITDMSDGRIARARGQVTPLGGLFDHGSDAIFVTTLLAAWSVLGEIPLCLPILVPLAFTQYMLDSNALSGQRLRASLIGRWNGVGYFVLAGVPTVRDALDLGWPATSLVRALGWVLICTTLVSMVERAWVYLRVRGAQG